MCGSAIPPVTDASTEVPRPNRKVAHARSSRRGIHRRVQLGLDVRRRSKALRGTIRAIGRQRGPTRESTSEDDDAG